RKIAAATPAPTIIVNPSSTFTVSEATTIRPARRREPGETPSGPCRTQSRASSRSSHCVRPNSTKIDNPRLSPRKPEKRPQFLGPRWRASRIASADVAITAANCEKRRAALSAAHKRSQVGDQRLLRRRLSIAAKGVIARRRNAKDAAAYSGGGPQASHRINRRSALD